MKGKMGRIFLGMIGVVLLFGIWPVKPVLEAAYTEEQYEEWTEDGTWEERLAFMEEINGVGYESQKQAVMEGNAVAGTWNDLADWNASQGQMPTTGDVRTLVFLVEFQDMKNTEANYTQENVKKVLFEVDGEWKTVGPATFVGSLSEYYAESSFGQLNVDGDVYGWYTASGNREDYADGAYGREKLVREVLSYYDGQIDYSQYDSNQDGYIDAIYINYAGGMDDWGDQWWSYKTNWFALEGDLQLDSVLPNGYVFIGDKYVENNQENVNFVVTAIHETGHLLGLPDYYDYLPCAGECGGLGGADMMDMNVGDHNPFSKLMLGWLKEEDVTIVELGDEFTSYDLAPFVEEGEILIVANEWNGSFCSEYYLVDYYQDKGLNKGMIDTNGGIRIWHVNAGLTLDGTNFANDNSYTTNKLLKIYEADGKEEVSGYFWMPGFNYIIKDEDLYHTGNSLTYATIPNSNYYGKIFTGININIGEGNEESYQINIKRDALNTDEPEIVRAYPDTAETQIYRDGVFNGRYITIDFDSVILVKDLSKITVETVSGTKAELGEIFVGDTFISFPIYGDSTTKATIRINPGFVTNISGVENTWNYIYSIGHLYALAQEGTYIAGTEYAENPWVRSTYYDAEQGVTYALVEAEYKIFWVSVDSNGQLTNKVLVNDALNSSRLVKLNDEAFFITYNTTYEEDIARRGVVFNRQGQILGNYVNEDYGTSYILYFKEPVAMGENKVGYYFGSNELIFYELTFDENYNVTEKKTKVTDLCNFSTLPLHWYFLEESMLGIGCYKSNEPMNENIEEMQKETTQRLVVWKWKDNVYSETEIVLSKEVGYLPMKVQYILEEEDFYRLFGISEDGNDGRDARFKFEVVNISKEDYTVLDYYTILEEQKGTVANVFINDVIKVQDDYIIQTKADVVQNATQLYSNREFNFYLGTDSSFNIDWVIISDDWHFDPIVEEPQKGLCIFSSAYKEELGSLKYYELSPEKKTRINCTIGNNLSEDKIVKTVVMGGKLRYTIPEVRGYDYKVYVNGTLVNVSSNNLVYDVEMTQSGNCVVNIVYEEKQNPVTGITLNKSVLDLGVGNTYELTATITPGDATNKTVTWKSSDTAVATVDSNGKVTAVAAGTAIITVTAEGGSGVSATCEVTVKEMSAREKQIRAFVSRMYTVALGREAEADGLDFYTERLLSGDSNGACLAQSFLCSPEFLNKGYDDAQYVKVLYKTFFDREPAAEEVNYWVGQLNGGKTRAFVLSGFVNSVEFDNLCAGYGISRGFMLEDGNPINPGIGRFAERLYTVILERAGEKEGIEYWSLQMANGVCTPKDAAKSFFLSAEYLNKNTSDAKYITTLYRTFMDREPEEGGVEYWQNVLNNGATREQILEGFADSAEFKGIMASFGL